MNVECFLLIKGVFNIGFRRRAACVRDSAFLRENLLHDCLA